MISNEVLLEVKGGSFTGTLLNSLSRFIGTVLDLGQTVGSSLRRGITKKMCRI